METFVIDRVVQFVALAVLLFATTPFAVGLEPCVVSQDHGVCGGGKGAFLPGEHTSNIRSLYIIDSHLDSQTFNQLSSFSSLTVLHVSNSSLTILPQGAAFATLPKLKHLHITYSNISEQFVNDILTRTPNIRSVSLERNKLARVPKCLFKTPKHLEAIDISHNDVFEIEPGAFENLPSLKRLDVSHNVIGHSFDNNVLVLPSGCAVCAGSTVKQRTCSEDTLRRCGSSTTVDELWTISNAGAVVRLVGNPLCSQVEIGPTYTENEETAGSEAVRVGGCLLYEHGKCPEHERRRRFLDAACSSEQQRRHHTKPRKVVDHPEGSGNETLKESNIQSGKQDGDDLNRGWVLPVGWVPGRTELKSLRNQRPKSVPGGGQSSETSNRHGKPNGDTVNPDWGPRRRKTRSEQDQRDKHDGGATRSSETDHTHRDLSDDVTNPGWGPPRRKSRIVQDQQEKQKGGVTHNSEEGHIHNNENGDVLNLGWGPLLRKTRSTQDQRDKHDVSATHSSEADYANRNLNGDVRNPGWGSQLRNTRSVQDQHDKHDGGATHSSEAEHAHSNRNGEVPNPGRGPSAGWGSPTGWGPALRKTRSVQDQRDKHDGGGGGGVAPHSSETGHAHGNPNSYTPNPGGPPQLRGGPAGGVVATTAAAAGVRSTASRRSGVGAAARIRSTPGLGAAPRVGPEPAAAGRRWRW